MKRMKFEGKVEIARAQSTESGATYYLLEDGLIMRQPVTGKPKPWKKYTEKAMAEIGIEALKKKFLSWDAASGKDAAWKVKMLFDEDCFAAPSFNDLQDWSNDGVCEAMDGCRVEPDGVCEHGFKSWLLVAGMI